MSCAHAVFTSCLGAFVFASIVGSTNAAATVAQGMAAGEYDIEAAADAIAKMTEYAELPDDFDSQLVHLVRETSEGPVVEVIRIDEADAVLQAKEEEVEVETSPIDEQVTVRHFKEDTSNAVAFLNRFTFHDNVLRQGSDHVAHWIIRFCHDWYFPCDELTPAFQEMAALYEGKLNKDDRFQVKVRFADVDCSTNKPLCNEQSGDGGAHFPRVVHFHQHVRKAFWNGGSDKARNVARLGKWLTQREGFISHATEKPAASKATPFVGPSLNQVGIGCIVLALVSVAQLWILVGKVLGVRPSAAGGKRESSQAGLAEPSGSHLIATTIQASTCMRQRSPSGVAAMLPCEWFSARPSSQEIEL